jgi:hypothetical protein
MGIETIVTEESQRIFNENARQETIQEMIQRQEENKRILEENNKFIAAAKQLLLEDKCIEAPLALRDQDVELNLRLTNIEKLLLERNKEPEKKDSEVIPVIEEDQRRRGVIPLLVVCKHLDNEVFNKFEVQESIRQILQQLGISRATFYAARDKGIPISLEIRPQERGWFVNVKQAKTHKIITKWFPSKKTLIENLSEIGFNRSYFNTLLKTSESIELTIIIKINNESLSTNEYKNMFSSEEVESILSHYKTLMDTNDPTPTKNLLKFINIQFPKVKTPKGCDWTEHSLNNHFICRPFQSKNTTYYSILKKIIDRRPELNPLTFKETRV